MHKDYVIEMKTDLRILQASQSPKVFNKAVELYLEKYGSPNNFSHCFREQWIKNHPFWYEGTALITPSTQAGQESVHGHTKDTFTENERVSMREMMNLSGEIAGNWSLDLRDHKPYETQPIIEENDWITAYKFAKKNIPVMRDPSDVDGQCNSEHWWVSAEYGGRITSKMIRNVKTLNWKTFDKFRDINFSAYEVTIQKPVDDSYVHVLCTCKLFQKKFKCTHSLGMKIRLKMIAVAEGIKRKVRAGRKKSTALPITRKHKTGRPAKAQVRLIRFLKK